MPFIEELLHRKEMRVTPHPLNRLKKCVTIEGAGTVFVGTEKECHIYIENHRPTRGMNPEVTR